MSNASCHVSLCEYSLSTNLANCPCLPLSCSWCPGVSASLALLEVGKDWRWVWHGCPSSKALEPSGLLLGQPLQAARSWWPLVSPSGLLNFLNGMSPGGRSLGSTLGCGCLALPVLERQASLVVSPLRPRWPCHHLWTWSGLRSKVGAAVRNSCPVCLTWTPAVFLAHGQHTCIRATPLLCP